MDASSHDVTALLAWSAGDRQPMTIAAAERDGQAARAWLLKELRGERRHDA